MKLFKSLFTYRHYVNKGLAAILLGLFIATLSTVIYLTYTLLNLNSLINTGTRIVGNEFVLQDLVTNIQTVESSQRGYIITGDKQYLTSYASSQQLVAADRKILAMQKFYQSSSTYKELSGVLDKKLAEVQSTIDAMNSQGQAAAVAIVTTNQGEQYMDRIHTLSATLANQATHVIIPRENQAHSNLHRALIVAPILVAFVLGICGSILIYFTKAIRKERALEGAKSEFLSLASHQLRTPATNVKQYIGLLTEGYLGKLSKQQKEALDVANRNNNAEIDIINGILNITKLDLNRIQLSKKPINLVELAEQVANEQRAAAKEKSQTITVSSADSSLTVPADQLYIKNALENLVDNACKYSPVKSKINIKLTKKARTAILTVEDEGIGIAKKDTGRLFKKFSRLEAAADYAQGSGLGLYWVKQIIAMHGGTISAEPGKKKGAVFTITLPLTG